MGPLVCVCMGGERAMEYGLSRLTPEQSVWGGTAAYWLHCGFRVLTVQKYFSICSLFFMVFGADELKTKCKVLLKMEFPPIF